MNETSTCSVPMSLNSHTRTEEFFWTPADQNEKDLMIKYEQHELDQMSANELDKNQ